MTGYRFIQVLILKQFSNENFPSKFWFQGAGVMGSGKQSFQLWLSGWAPDLRDVWLVSLWTAGSFSWHAEHGISISMMFFAYLNSALQFEATETHLMKGGDRTAEGSQDGTGELSLEVSEARTDPCSPPTHRDLLTAVNQQRQRREGGVVQHPLCSLLFNCPPPPFKSLYTSPQNFPQSDVSCDRAHCFILVSMCLVQPLFRKETMPDSFSARATACNTAEKQKWDQSLMCLDRIFKQPERKHGYLWLPVSGLHGSVLSAAFSSLIFLKELRCQVCENGGSSFLGLLVLSLINSLSHKNQHFFYDLKASCQQVCTKNVQKNLFFLDFPS